MAINQPGQNDSAMTIYLSQLTFIVLHPRMAKNVTLASGGNDLPSPAEHRGVFDQSNVVQRWPAARTSFPTQSEELTNVGQKKVRRCSFSIRNRFQKGKFPILSS